ncbi:phosphoenolpyruvate--protein phosphotransferase [Geotalea sp. SG265]|uniref:phosphoenolpyruvate--protein phosphotransferase n=1 Tax=Geotalea sp. SG265 TaxID=2922867 RepID=UPI001FAE8727|nr:phosphoenolpyruvate--protein phosphotransferase [Geotalea sp. SG265]
MGEEHNETLGLRTLEDISGLILHSHDLQETLDNIVNLVSRRVGSDVCSIYLLENDGETLRLKATKGLSRGSVGKITMKTSEGLTGLAVEERGIIATDNAPLHPRYKYFRETREEKFLSFLGVPLFERKTPVGVLVVQTREARVFTPAEISTISTIAYQISSIVINAKLLDSINQKEKERAFFASELEKMRAGERKGKMHADQEKKHRTSSLIGTPVSPGFAWGKIYIFSRSEHDGIAMEHAGTPSEERKRFQIALEKAKIQTLYMEKRVAQVMSKEDAAIFHSHLMFLEDRGFIAKIADHIDNGFSAGQAVREVVGYYVNAFAKMEDPYLRERSADMEDIGRRLLDAMNGNNGSWRKFREKRIIIADDILPSDMATMDHEKILGIVTEKGNAGSHAAIMARSLGIPAIVGVEGLTKQLSPRTEVIVDGTSGHLYINPTLRIKEEYERLVRDFSLKQRELEGLRDLRAETSDGSRVFLRANIGLLNDVKVAQANGAEGVGLYRTEFPYMTRKTFPNRSEQYNLYRKIVEGFPDFPVTIRTLDIGGDKGLSYFPFPKEDNPFMGWRSIRVSLEEEHIFREQLASILMASAHGRVAVMFPMISSIEEIRTVKRILGEVKEELSAESRPFDPSIPLGIMVELPAAVQIAHMLMKEVDFFSIGTNDLIQYTLAADRNNPKVREYYDPYHPAILHSVKRVADVALAAGKKASLCGEMAADPMNAILLMGMGITDFSLSAPYIPLVKQAVRQTTMADAREIAAQALQLESSTAIRAYLEKTRLLLKL